MQKRATKVLRQCRRLNYRQRLKFLNLPTLAFRRNRGDMIEVYKILMGKYDPTLPSILHRNINSTTRGNPLKLSTSASSASPRFIDKLTCATHLQWGIHIVGYDVAAEL